MKATLPSNSVATNFSSQCGPTGVRPISGPRMVCPMLNPVSGIHGFRGSQPVEDHSGELCRQRLEIQAPIGLVPLDGPVDGADEHVGYRRHIDIGADLAGVLGLGKQLAPVRGERALLGETWVPHLL